MRPPPNFTLYVVTRSPRAAISSRHSSSVHDRRLARYVWAPSTLLRPVPNGSQLAASRDRPRATIGPVGNVATASEEWLMGQARHSAWAPPGKCSAAYFPPRTPGEPSRAP